VKETLQDRLGIDSVVIDEINELLRDPKSRVIQDFLTVVRKYGTPEEINQKADAARALPNLLRRLDETGSPYRKDLDWLRDQRDRGAFISMADYRRTVLAGRADETPFDEDLAVTLEISAFQYFPWLVREAQQAIEGGELMPGRFIRVRRMKESEADGGDLAAVAAAMQVIGASYVETLDTKGTDGSNVHLGGPATITGYFGGIGQPNEHALQWLEEYLYYYTTYGVRQVLNINPGTVLLGYLLHKLGVDNEFKISVFMGNDNPYSALWTLLTAKLFSRPDGTTPLIGFNLSNSVDNTTIELSADIRGALDFERAVRFEHHIIEAWKSIVRQPYDRRAELVPLARRVANISAKHEGGDPETEVTRAHPSDILDYFRAKDEVLEKDEMAVLESNYLDKHAALNHTARVLTEHGLAVIAASHLHAQASRQPVPA
jgi:hypothetical protein